MIKDIKGYEGLYQISSDGYVISLKTKRAMQPYINNSGYACLKLSRQGKAKSFTLHRLVALSFVNGYSHDLEVNHIDGNKLNNAASNLEWVTKGENLKHKYKLFAEYKELCKSFLGRKHANSASKFHNVSWDKSRNKWSAKLTHNGAVINLGRFLDEVEAAKAVDAYVIKENIKRPLNRCLLNA